mmetsp:Transcript_32763/g.93954  ORF Transcript_32763/g.93954 Transcript_32763/m.93954 type:complete len:202 (-) Transcript_32763:1359-1964(-)
MAEGRAVGRDQGQRLRDDEHCGPGQRRWSTLSDGLEQRGMIGAQGVKDLRRAGSKLQAAGHAELQDADCARMVLLSPEGEGGVGPLGALLWHCKREARHKQHIHQGGVQAMAFVSHGQGDGLRASVRRREQGHIDGGTNEEGAHQLPMAEERCRSLRPYCSEGPQGHQRRLTHMGLLGLCGESLADGASHCAQCVQWLFTR